MNPTHLPSDPHTVATFKALVDAIIPNTPNLAWFGAEQVAGAVELDIDQYMIWELDHSLSLFLRINLEIVILSSSTAMLLDAGAVQLIATGRAMDPQNGYIIGGGPFTTLSHADRIRTMAVLEQLEVDLGCLPPPYQNNGGWVQFIVDYLNRGTMFGYYSEWSGYGSTRLATPRQRRLEDFPIGWIQAGYPGVSLGYRDFRGFLLKLIHKGENPDNV